MHRSLRATVTTLAIVSLLGVSAIPVDAHGDNVDPSTHWLSLINTAHEDPSNLMVIIVPPTYFSANAMVFETGWVGTGGVYDLPAVQATLEAVEYWAWAIDQYATAYPSAQSIGFTVRVLGHDAGLPELGTADIVINTAMVADPALFIFHAGVGLPTYPMGALFGGRESNSMYKCTVQNSGLGTTGAKDEPTRLRNLVIHEFGHCLAAGHTGTSLGANHCSSHHGCFDQHPTDVMSSVEAGHRQCLSNLNIQSLDGAYVGFATTGSWQPHAGETFMKKTDYGVKCQPASMHRF